ncbi:hypothetical protein MNBD_GAMMA04-1254 [hydrothermal vent metagenome]|uniref:DUF2442 domain-containing protein n=2 Tax=hydrothermal vent metagenome TaxID=652676 RepID=A0A3B0VX77_9ZZZZ
MLIHVTKAKYLHDYEVELTFNDGKTGIVNLENELYGTMFEPLKDKKVFSSVKLDKEIDTISWKNGADLAPEFLYYQSFKDDKSLTEQFKQWGYI